MPANVVKKYKQFYFKIIKAEHLPCMDTFGTIDAYIKFEMDKKSKVKTKVVKMEDNLVEWNQEILVPIELPNNKDNLIFELYDQDLTSDDLVATLTFSIKNIIKRVGSDGKKRQYHLEWFNLYGANTSGSGDNVTIQNEQIEHSTTFKGRVLIEYSCIDMESPVFKVQDIDQKDEEFKQRLDNLQKKKY